MKYAIFFEKGLFNMHLVHFVILMLKQTFQSLREKPLFCKMIEFMYLIIMNKLEAFRF